MIQYPSSGLLTRFGEMVQRGTQCRLHSVSQWRSPSLRSRNRGPFLGMIPLIQGPTVNPCHVCACIWGGGSAIPPPHFCPRPGTDSQPSWVPVRVQARGTLCKATSFTAGPEKQTLLCSHGIWSVTNEGRNKMKGQLGSAVHGRVTDQYCSELSGGRLT